MDNLFNGIEKTINDDGLIDVAAFGNFINEDTAIKLAHYFINRLNEHHHYIPPFNILTSTRTILINNSSFVLELEMIESEHADRELVSNTLSLQVVGVLTGAVTRTRWELEGDRLGLESETRLAAGATVSIDHEFIHFRNVSDQPATLLILTSKKRMDDVSAVQVFKRSTGERSHLVSRRLASSRIEAMLGVIGELNYTPAKSLSRSLSKAHPDYFVRWEASRTFARLAPDEAIEHMESILESETHEHVRNAAKKSVALLRARLKE